MKRVLDFAHTIISLYVSKEDICVDMTIGNGNDTLFLCEISKFVYGFDIQQLAIENTKKLLNENNISNYKLILDSHNNVDTYVNEKIKAFIFNLGYLPKGDKSITTNYVSTLEAINKSLKLLEINGLIVLVIYPGHEEGKIESTYINEYVATLNQKQYDVVTYKFLNQVNNPPYVIVIERKL